MRRRHRVGELTAAGDPAEGAGWLDEQRWRADRDRLLVAIPLFLATGRRG